MPGNVSGVDGLTRGYIGGYYLDYDTKLQGSTAPMPAAGSWSSGDKRRGTRLHRLCTRSGPQCRSWSSRPGRAPPKPPGDLVGGLRAEAARWGARFRGLICALEIRVSFSDGDGVAAAPAAASPPLLPTPPPMMPSRTTPFKHKATPFERFMHESMGVPDGKTQQ